MSNEVCPFGGEHGSWVRIGGFDPFTGKEEKIWVCGKCGKPEEDCK